MMVNREALLVSKIFSLVTGREKQALTAQDIIKKYTQETMLPTFVAFLAMETFKKLKKAVVIPENIYILANIR